MQFAQHRSDCHRATTRLFPSFFLVSLLSETTHQILLFPWKQQAIKNPYEVMFPSERQTPCWHYQLVSGLLTLHSCTFPHFFISSEIKFNQARAMSAFWKASERLLFSGRIPVTDYWQLCNINPGFPSPGTDYQWTISLGEHHYFSIVLKLVAVILHWILQAPEPYIQSRVFRFRANRRDEHINCFWPTQTRRGLWGSFSLSQAHWLKASSQQKDTREYWLLSSEGEKTILI